MGRKTYAAAAAALLLGAGCAWWGGRATGDPATGAAMAQIVAALRVALPLSLSAERFAAPENEPALASSLAALRAGAHELENHGRSQDASFAFLSRSLARDAEEIKRRFDGGRLDETRFLLGALVDDCIGCHSRLPSEGDSDLGRSLFEAVDASGLTPLEQARFEVASRQFDAALARYEALLVASAESPAELDLEGVPADYLTLAIRVREDLPRARKGLGAFAARADLPSYLATLVAQWIEACDALQGAIRADDLLPEAERVLDAGDVLSRYGRDRAGARPPARRIQPAAALRGRASRGDPGNRPRLLPARRHRAAQRAFLAGSPRRRATSRRRSAPLRAPTGRSAPTCSSRSRPSRTTRARGASTCRPRCASGSTSSARSPSAADPAAAPARRDAHHLHTTLPESVRAALVSGITAARAQEGHASPRSDGTTRGDRVPCIAGLRAQRSGCYSPSDCWRAAATSRASASD